MSRHPLIAPCFSLLHAVSFIRGSFICQIKVKGGKDENVSISAGDLPGTSAIASATY